MTQTLKEIVMAVACAWYALVRGAATHRVSHPARIVVIQLAKLGDMVCTTPMFTAIKEAHPGARLTVVGSAINKHVLADHPHVDEYVVFRGVWPMVRWLRANPQDFGCSATPSMAALTALFLGGVRSVAVPVVTHGHSPLETVSYKATRGLVHVRPHRMGHYAPGEYLRLLEPVGVTTEDTTKTLGFSDDARHRIGLLCSQEGIHDGDLLVGVSPSAGNKVKEWPAERFGAVADWLIEQHGATVLIIGGPTDAPLADAMKASMHHAARVVDCTARLSVDELKALMARLTLFVAVDTGPVYVAEAFGTATVDIVGPMDENEQPPRGERHRVIVTEGHVPQMHILDAHPKDETEARRQVEAISVEQVQQAIGELLPSIRKKV